MFGAFQTRAPSRRPASPPENNLREIQCRNLGPDQDRIKLDFHSLDDQNKRNSARRDPRIFGARHFVGNGMIGPYAIQVPVQTVQCVLAWAPLTASTDLCPSLQIHEIIHYWLEVSLPCGFENSYLRRLYRNPSLAPAPLCHCSGTAQVTTNRARLCLMLFQHRVRCCVNTSSGLVCETPRSFCSCLAQLEPLTAWVRAQSDWAERWIALSGSLPPSICCFNLIVDLHPEVTRVFHRELTRLKVMFCGLCLGQDMRGLPFRFGYC